MRRLVLAVSVLVCGVAGSSSPAYADCCSRGCEKVAYRSCNKCKKVAKRDCNKCKKVAFSGCNRCDRVAFKSCNRCDKVAFRGCNRCDKVAYRGCDPCHRTSFFGFLGLGHRHGHASTDYVSADYVSANYGTGYDLRYDTRFMPGPSGYPSDYQLGYEPNSGYRSSTTTGVYLAASQPSFIDSTFIREAAIANMANVELGRLALQNASSTEVRNFGQQLVDDHGRTLSNLESVANRMNLNVPDDLDPQRAQLEQRLSSLTASEFDRQFMDAMVRDHRETIAKFEARAASAPANEIQSFAIENLPTMRHHLQKAMDIQARIRD